MRARATRDTKDTSSTAGSAQAQGAVNDARLAAVVEAAYLLEARTR
jgi:hypothetical protein